jgi:lysyl-tRNA synthetase class 2
MASTQTVSEQQEVRSRKRERLIEVAGSAYPVGLKPTAKIADLVKTYTELEPDETTGVVVSVAGRAVMVRNGGKLCFSVLQAGDGARIQLMVSFNALGEVSHKLWKELIDLGDHVFVTGEVVASRTGELSIMVQSWEIAAKALRPLPSVHTELNEENRARHRYLDLIVREDAREMVYRRAAVMASLRSTLTGRGLLEIETPMLQTIQGGASARPFVTRSNALGNELYLRIAPELFLKRAVVGGIDQVFEINRNFRNEGVDSTHSPEFAMLEAYCAYSDYDQMAELTQEMIQSVVTAVFGGTVATWLDGTEYDFGGEWDSISMYESLSTAIGVRITPDTSAAELSALADEHQVTVKVPTHGKYVEELWDHFVKPTLSAPTFVRDFPVDTSPLVAPHRTIDGVVEKWDLYINGFELATGYSELVDPIVQRERLVAQAALGGRGDAEAMPLDEDFLEALEYGMPPTGGIGMGIDRLLMALTGQGIRETILFPLVK